MTFLENMNFNEETKLIACWNWICDVLLLMDFSCHLQHQISTYLHNYLSLSVVFCSNHLCFFSKVRRGQMCFMLSWLFLLSLLRFFYVCTLQTYLSTKLPSAQWQKNYEIVQIFSSKYRKLFCIIDIHCNQFIMSTLFLFIFSQVFLIWIKTWPKWLADFH